MLPIPTLRRNGLYKTLIGSAIGLLFSLMLALSPMLPSSAISVADVPNPQVTEGLWVTDMAGMLSDQSENELNIMISQLEVNKGIEIAVVTVPDTQGYSSPKAFATELFNTWGIGKAGADNGLLFLISKGDRRNEIETGYGLEGVLSDAQVGAILREQVTPQFKAGNFDAGVLAGTQTIVSILSGERSGDAYKKAPGNALFTKLLRLPRIIFNWLFDGLGLATIAIAIATRTLLKKLAKGHTEPIHIGPTGNSRLSELPPTFLGPELTVSLRALIGKDIGQATKLAYSQGDSAASKKLRSALWVDPSTLFRKQIFKDATQQSEHLESRLIAIRWSEDLIYSGWKLFGFFFIISFIAACVIQENAIHLIGYGWLWMSYEMYLSMNWAARIHPSASPRNIIRTALKTIFSNLQISLTGILISGVLMATGFGLPIAPFFLAAFFGTCAGILRLVRQLPVGHPIHCRNCDAPMEQLSEEQLMKHTRKTAKIEMSLGSKRYEGWCCQTCAIKSPITDSIPRDTQKNKQPEPNLSIHIFSQVIKTSGYTRCTTCDALTAKVEKTVLENATTAKTGRQQITQDCQCCGSHNQHEVVIPKVTVTTPSSSSSYSSYSSSSYDSGGSYSSSSSYDSGGSFGGGDSGGGGAGDSW